MNRLWIGGTMAMLLGVLAGCEWEGSGDGDSWNSAYSWVNFGGVYRPPADKTFLVSLHAPAAASPASVENASQSIGTGNGSFATFSDTLEKTPVVLGSVQVTDGTETFLENPAGSGALLGSMGGVGTVNYATGAISVSFALSPGNVSIRVTYQYSKSGTPASPSPGSSAEIFTMSVDQVGNKLYMTDNKGRRYEGQINSISSTGGDTAGMSSGTMVGNFFANGNGVKITGTFQGLYTAGEIENGVRLPGMLSDRLMLGTWVEQNITGDIFGEGGGVLITTGTNAPPVIGTTPPPTTTPTVPVTPTTP